MVRSIAREFRWPPDLIGGFFIDDQDTRGVLFWYEDIKTQVKDLESKK